MIQRACFKCIVLRRRVHLVCACVRARTCTSVRHRAKACRGRQTAQTQFPRGLSKMYGLCRKLGQSDPKWRHCSRKKPPSQYSSAFPHSRARLSGPGPVTRGPDPGRTPACGRVRNDAALADALFFFFFFLYPSLQLVISC